MSIILVPVNCSACRKWTGPAVHKMMAQWWKMNITQNNVITTEIQSTLVLECSDIWLLKELIISSLWLVQSVLGNPHKHCVYSRGFIELIQFTHACDFVKEFNWLLVSIIIHALIWNYLLLFVCLSEGEAEWG